MLFIDAYNKVCARNGCQNHNLTDDNQVAMSNGNSDADAGSPSSDNANPKQNTQRRKEGAQPET